MSGTYSRCHSPAAGFGTDVELRSPQQDGDYHGLAQVDLIDARLMFADAIEEEIGRGGMATVYRAYQPSVDRYVALKVMQRSIAEDEEAMGRFQREARVVARLGPGAFRPPPKVDSAMVRLSLREEPLHGDLDERRFRDMELGGDRLDTWPIYTEIAEADLVINVPIVKHHGLTGATLAMKNWYGVLGGFLLGVGRLPVPWQALLLSISIYVALPLVAGYLTRKWIVTGSPALMARTAFRARSNVAKGSACVPGFESLPLGAT